MKTIANTLITCALTVTTGASAQNWTATDINGTTHTLQDYLDQGKTVLVDVSAYWCIPCWSLHKSGIHERIFEEFGPGGTGDVMVFFIDADPASTMSLLQGGAGSVGDWIEGTPYPIIGPSGEGASVAAVYGVQSYPTLFVHCPGSALGVEIATTEPWEEFLADWRDACPAAFENGAIDAHLLHIEDKEFCSSEHPVTDVFNQGTAPLTAATVTLSFDGNLIETVEWTGSIPAFAHQEVAFPNATILTDGAYTMEVTVTGDAEPAGNTETMDLHPAPTSPTAYVTLELRTDNEPQETAWQLLDANGTVIDHDPPGAYAANTTYTYAWSLNTAACYTFRINDQDGDGICCDHGNGHYVLRNTWGVPVEFAQGGEFITFSEYRDFETPDVVGLDESPGSPEVLIAPNPADDGVRVLLPADLPGPMTLDVFDARGALVAHHRNFSSGQVMAVTALADGIYSLRISNATFTTTQRLLVQH